jgi:para-aminobenzoate synthetase component 1
VHDYLANATFLTGRREGCERIENALNTDLPRSDRNPHSAEAVSSFSRSQYLNAIDEIQERIRAGETYQTNLTQKISVDLPDSFSLGAVFEAIRNEHPAPFAAYIERPGSTVISASPERFFKVVDGVVTAAPIKGTRPRGRDRIEGERLLKELLSSEKDRAENTMIVDLLRNDLGRVCEYGSVEVTELCRPLTLPSVFHLVSAVRGRLRPNAKPSDILRALFPCGSITGAPKISTMQIIRELERSPRGLSMGAIGVYIPPGFGVEPVLDVSVAIRTMVIRNGIATFNVGGGVTIDSDPEMEYEESWAKAAALLHALGSKRPAETF